MTSKYVILASALLISVATFAQKDQIKAAEKAIKKGNHQEAITILTEAEPVMANATEVEKAQYYFAQGNAYYGLAYKYIDESKNLSLAAKSYDKLYVIEKASGANKYSTQAVPSMIEVKNKLINSAVSDNQAGKYNVSGGKLYDAYLMDRTDTINLYYSASSYVNGKEYKAALKVYEELKAMNYKGKGKNNFAVSKITGKEDLFETSKERNNAVKIGTHEKPRTEQVPSKKGEIYKNIALILVQEGKTEEAKQAFTDARKQDKNDTSLILAEADLYLGLKEYDTYKKLIAEALKKNPDDADLIFNLGVISANAKNTEEAEKYYKRVIELKPEEINAYINLAALKLENEKTIVDEMNNLGNTANEMKRYNVLKTEREGIFKETIPYLKKANELEPENIDVAKTLLGVYSALEMPEAKTLNAKIKEMESK